MTIVLTGRQVGGVALAALGLVATGVAQFLPWITAELIQFSPWRITTLFESTTWWDSRTDGSPAIGFLRVAPFLFIGALVVAGVGSGMLGSRRSRAGGAIVLAGAAIFAATLAGWTFAAHAQADGDPYNWTAGLWLGLGGVVAVMVGGTVGGIRQGGLPTGVAQQAPRTGNGHSVWSAPAPLQVEPVRLPPASCPKCGSNAMRQDGAQIGSKIPVTCSGCGLRGRITAA